jgi:type IV pilus assembly protein PilX
MKKLQRAIFAVRAAERGMVLISSLLLLLVVTILAVAIFRNYGMEEKIAGNTREKQRALHAAESAQQYAEWWLSSGLGCNHAHRSATRSFR